MEVPINVSTDGISENPRLDMRSSTVSIRNSKVNRSQVSMEQELERSLVNDISTYRLGDGPRYQRPPRSIHTRHHPEVETLPKTRGLIRTADDQGCVVLR